MKRLKKLGKCWNFLVLTIILCAFVGGFYISSSLYSYRSKDSYLVTLDKKIFNMEASERNKNYFAVSKITKFSLPYIVLDCDFLDMNTIALIGWADRSNSGIVGTGIYDMAKSEFVDELNKIKGIYNGTISLSGNSKMILASYFSKYKDLNVTYIYDVLRKEKLHVYDNVAATAWLPDSSGFVGVDDYLFVQNIKTGKRENLAKTGALTERSFRDSLRLKVSKDGQVIYVYGFLNKDISTFVMDRKTGKQIEIRNTEIYNMVTIYEKNIVILGTVDGIYGIYLYDHEKDAFKKLISLEDRKLMDVCMSQDGKKLAYTIMSDGGISEVHAVYLNEGKAISDEVIYKDSGVVSKLVWSKDGQMLYCFYTDRDHTSVYRILFKSN